MLLNAIQAGIDSGDFHTRPNFGLQEMAYAAWSMVHGIAMLRLTILTDHGPGQMAVDHAVLDSLVRGLSGGDTVA